MRLKLNYTMRALKRCLCKIWSGPNTLTGCHGFYIDATAAAAVAAAAAAATAAPRPRRGCATAALAPAKKNRRADPSGKKNRRVDPSGKEKSTKTSIFEELRIFGRHHQILRERLRI